jgi:hypothetical protein
MRERVSPVLSRNAVRLSSVAEYSEATMHRPTGGNQSVWSDER